MGPSVETSVDSRVFLKIGEVVARAVGEETILVPIRGKVGDLDSVYTLSAVAARVWSLVDGVRDVSSIAETLSEEYEVPQAVAAADVASFLLGMVEAQLLREVIR